MNPANIDYRAALTALIVAGTITTDEAELVMQDRTYMQGEPDTTPWDAARNLQLALARVRSYNPGEAAAMLTAARQGRQRDPMTDDEAWRLWLAWNDPGIQPAYHHHMQQRLRNEWSVLASALDRMRRPDEGSSANALTP